MAYTLKIEEAMPDAWPTVATDLASASTAFLGAVWQRLESFIAWRWGERVCVFIVEGPGVWVPPLTPVTITTSQVWTEAGEWEAVALAPSAYGGFDLKKVGPYRFTTTLGSTDDPPPAVQEAFRRLAHYLAEQDGREAGMVETALDGLGAFKFAPGPMAAKSLVYSGAGDLLRPYRKLGAS